MVIETTGVADPLPIILTFLGTELRDMTRLDSIVTMVDSETFTPEHFDREAVFKQITYVRFPTSSRNRESNIAYVVTCLLLASRFSRRPFNS